MQQVLPGHLALLARYLHQGACAALFCGLCCAQALAQSGATSDAYTTYALRYKPAAEVSRMLAEILGQEVRMVVDQHTNQLQVRGPEKSQRIAQRLIEMVDQPGQQPIKAADAARALQSGAQQPGTSSTAGEQFVPLPTVRTAEIEPMLRKLLGQRLKRQPISRQGRAEFVVGDDDGARVTLRIDETRGGVAVVGSQPLMGNTVRLIQAHTGPAPAAGSAIRTVSLRKADPKKVQEAVDAYRRGNPKPAQAPGQLGANRRASSPLQMAQAAAGGDAPPSAPTGQPAEGTPGANFDAEKTRDRLRELGLDLDIEILPDLDAIILRGSNRDVNEVLRIIEDIERLSAETVPQVEVYPLKHVGSETLAPLLTQIQKDLLAGRPGRVTITALNKPNALLLVGWGDAVNSVKELIDKLDQPVEPQTQLRVFRLKYAPAATASTTVQEFFGKRTGLGTKVTVTADVRSNSLIVQASPRDMAEVELLITRLDTERSDSVNQVRVFKLKNSLATNLAATLQSAIESQRTGQGATGGAKSSVLELLTVDAQGERIIKSGILADVKITPDARANTIVVSAPAASMDLVAALIQQMDDSPVAVSQIKVFHIVNGDAPGLVQMLRAILPSQTTTTPAATLAKAEGETSFAPLRYSVETRTNSIIATGSAGDLAIIEALLLRLDEKDVQQRKNTVYQLKNAPALDVAFAVNEFLRSERQVQQAAPGTISPFQQIEGEVVVVPEPVGNSLIISATPRFYEEIEKIVKRLDAQPAQVLIQVLIAEVSLTDDTQFGIEFGLQNGLLFDRSLLGGLVTTNTSTTFGNPPTTTQTQTIQAASNTPGFDFNNAQIGNSGSTKSLNTAAETGLQGLSNFAVGRSSDTLGFGGLVLSAGSKSINALLRALQQNQRLEILSRPQVMTIDNQPAFIQVGQRVPRITGVQLNQIGQSNSIVLENVGLILGVTPRISPEGMVVMEIDAEKSEVGPDIEGIPVSISATGVVIRSPRINVTTAQTTISTADGETIVLGGLITKSEKKIDRRVPYLSSVPVLGQLFRYDQFSGKRTELLIILTPHVVRSAGDAQRVKQIEAARMHWCAADVHAIHGDPEFCKRGLCPICNEKMPVIYPDVDPRGVQPTPLPEELLPNADDEPGELPDAGVSAQKGPRKGPATGTKSRGPTAAEIRAAAVPGVQPSGYTVPSAPTGAPTGTPIPVRLPANQTRASTYPQTNYQSR